MRRILMVLLLAVCGCSGDGFVLQGRLDVTPQLRGDCDGVAGGDPIIEAMIHAIEQDRLDGVSFVDGAVAINQSCPFEDCITCVVAILNQVYDI